MGVRVASFTIFSTLAFASGCSGQVVATADADAIATEALLAIDIVAPAGQDARATRMHASAHFLRMPSSTDEDLAKFLVGAALELPGIGECESVAPFGNERGIPLAPFGPIDLVDVGTVTIEAGAARAPLAARAFPDVVDLISGVVYTTRDAADSFPAPAPYRFEATGSAQIGPLVIETSAPSLPRDIRIGDQPLGAEPVFIERGPLPISWEPSPASDLVYIDLTSYEPTRLVRSRCTFADDGQAVIPEEALPSAKTAGISLHRVERQTILSPPFDGGEIRFDLAVSGTLSFEREEPLEESSETEEKSL